MKNKLFIIHRGNQDYLQFCIKQALYFNNEIVLIGDKSNSKIKGITHVNMDELESEESGFFEKNYIHMSTNFYEYELLCFKRWFYLNEYLKRNKIQEKIFCMDSDVLLYTTANTIIENFNQYDMGMMRDENDSTSAGISFWNQENLQLFCDFILEKYKNSLLEFQNYWKKIQIANVSGGISDMTMCTFFYKKHKEKIANLIEIKEDTVLDFLINSQTQVHHDTEKFKMKGIYKHRKFQKYISYNSKLELEYDIYEPFYIKNITKTKNLPYGELLDSNNHINFYLLHFQGKHKGVMYYFVSYNNIFTRLFEYLTHKFLIFLYANYRLIKKIVLKK